MGRGKKSLLFFFIQMGSVVNDVDLELVSMNLWNIWKQQAKR
jgi:hypothetical protein